MENTGLYCQYCGELNDAQAQFCRKCGKPQVQVPPVSAQAGGTQAPSPIIPPAAGQVPTGYPPPPPAAAAEFHGYAGFWIRFLAVIIDGAVVSAVMIPLWIVFGGVMIAALGVHPTAPPSLPSVPGEPPDMRAFMGFLPMLAMFWPVGIAVNWLYEALMTSSSRQATLGKMALHLKVTDRDGRRLSFLHATGRHFAKWINNVTMYIGYIMAGLTERKQGLHDMIAGTYVIKT